MRSGLLPLFAWLSPAFPVGSFAYSHGLEYVVRNGDMHDANTLLSWLGDLLAHGAIRTDLILAAVAARSALAQDMNEFARASELALALAPSRERHLETTQQGRSFVDMVRSAWPSAALDGLFDASDEIAYPIAFGGAVAAHRLALGPSLAAYTLQFVSNLVSAVVRLGTVGQTDGQKVIASLAKPARRAAAFATRAQLDDVGAAAFRLDIASLRHETQYSRLFRS
jgi:urease accessory protein